MYVKQIVSVAGLCIALTASLANAAVITPSFAAVPTGWSTDRYDPASFSDVGAYQGRSDVLGIAIDHTGDLANRPAANQFVFYNTQGKGYALSGGAGSVLSADLYIPTAWGDAANGNVRTDMWGVATDGTGVSAYPIIGFTNYGGAARLRVWDDDIGWTDLSTAVTFDAWTTLAINFTGTSFDFSVNGANVYSDTTINGSTGFSSILMQAYNFADPASVPGAVTTPYIAHWANTKVADVPEPGSAALCLVGLLGLAARRRKSALSSNA